MKLGVKRSEKVKKVAYLTVNSFLKWKVSIFFFLSFTLNSRVCSVTALYLKLERKKLWRRKMWIVPFWFDNHWRLWCYELWWYGSLQGYLIVLEEQTGELLQIELGPVPHLLLLHVSARCRLVQEILSETILQVVINFIKFWSSWIQDQEKSIFYIINN